MDTRTISLAQSIEMLADPETAARPARSLEYILRLYGEGAQKELAEHLGVSRQTVHTWRTGAVKMSPQTVVKIAAKYDVPVELMYSDNHLDVATWLLENKRSDFRCNMMDEAPKVA